MKLETAFNMTKTNNGDIAYASSNNIVFDLIFSLIEYRNKDKNISIDVINGIKDMFGEDNIITFVNLIRDPRYGFGEREVGRKLYSLLYNNGIINESELISNVFKYGRFDDLLSIVDFNNNTSVKNVYSKVFDILRDTKTEDIVSFNIKKWMPRQSSKWHKKYLTLLHVFNLKPSEYRKLVSTKMTVESKLSSKTFPEDYSKVPSLAMLKYYSTFLKKDPNFKEYLNSVKRGEKKINTSTMTPVDLGREYTNQKISSNDCQIIYDNMDKCVFNNILTILDNSGSMYSMNNNYIAKSICHYVSSNTTYKAGTFITFSNYPKLLNFDINSYKDAFKVMNSFSDVGSTDFGKVMQVLSKVTEDLPDFLLVLSDMQFDNGSSNSKEEAMKILKNYNPNLKIIWWNLESKRTTFPEVDEYGNIFISGYNPKMLSLLECGFDMKKFINTMFEKYKSAISSADIVELYI